jgi:hypothetical protein
MDKQSGALATAALQIATTILIRLVENGTIHAADIDALDEDLAEILEGDDVAIAASIIDAHVRPSLAIARQIAQQRGAG